MTSVDALRQEAAEIRRRYQGTQDPDERKRLQARYQEVDAQIQVAQSTAKPIKRKKRVSLGHPDQLDEDAIKLLELCEVVTQDGTLSDSEIDTLRSWLSRRQRGTNPAIDFLADAVELVRTDQEITAVQRKELYKAVETVLPTDRRRFAVQRRKMAETLEKERQKSEKAAERQRQKEERLLASPIFTADFMTAGVSYEGRATVIQKCVKSGDTVYLKRDRMSKYSRNAIEIRTIHGFQIGYVPEEDAADLVDYFDKGYPHMASVKKILTGGDNPIPVVVAQIFNRESPIRGLIFERNVPRASIPGWLFERSVPGQHTKSGCLGLVIAILFVTGILMSFAPSG